MSIDSECEALRKALELALQEAHHKDACPHRWWKPCTCWRSVAHKALGTAEPKGRGRNKR